MSIMIATSPEINLNLLKVALLQERSYVGLGTRVNAC